ncbi:MAG TPA: GntR family transcriptional regulator [Chloroflexota bacterium]|nr:GntR family transcriptional regulator [Chloroflexota bacterium]
MGRSQTELALALLKQHILDLKLPPGRLVTEKELIELTGCGRTPVREAMQRLQRDGLLQIVPFRGAFITEISSKDVDEISQVREQLESFAAGLAARLMTPQEVARACAVLEALEPLSGRTASEIFAVDRQFHLMIIEGSRHGRIREIIGMLSDQIQRLRSLSAADPRRAVAAHAEHRAIAAALAARDPERAEAAMRVHLQHSHQSLLDVVGYAARRNVTEEVVAQPDARR